MRNRGLTKVRARHRAHEPSQTTAFTRRLRRDATIVIICPPRAIPPREATCARQCIRARDLIYPVSRRTHVGRLCAGDVLSLSASLTPLGRIYRNRMTWEPRRDQMLTLMQIAALAVAGMCHALLGSVKVPLARETRYRRGAGRRPGERVRVHADPMVLVAGFLVDWLGRQAVLFRRFVLLTVSLVLLARLKSYGMALVAVLVLGTGCRGWSTCSTSRRRRRSCRPKTLPHACPTP